MNENVRLETGTVDLCRMKYILTKNEEIAEKTSLNRTILADLTNATDVMTAALNVTKRYNAPVVCYNTWSGGFI